MTEAAEISTSQESVLQTATKEATPYATGKLRTWTAPEARVHGNRLAFVMVSSPLRNLRWCGPRPAGGSRQWTSRVWTLGHGPDNRRARDQLCPGSRDRRGCAGGGSPHVVHVTQSTAPAHSLGGGGTGGHCSPAPLNSDTLPLGCRDQKLEEGLRASGGTVLPQGQWHLPLTPQSPDDF